jgi:1-acyl-sn-glycerol-3-phosphate acyltransferase
MILPFANRLFFFMKYWIINLMIRTILILICIGSSFAILFPFGIIALFISLFGLKKQMTQVIYRIAQGWALSILWITGCTVTVEGKENIPKKGGVCFVANHTGYFDIVLLFACCGRPVGFIAKKELSFVPFLNAWVYMVGGQFLDRKSPRKALRTINRGVESIKSGGGMIIFPEGHRSKGAGLLPFHPGSLKLATMAEAPIVPVAMTGSYDVFEKNYRANRVNTKVVFCEPIETANLPQEDRKVVLSDRIYSVIEEQLSKM